MSVYYLNYHGGPRDGQQCLSPRPYDGMKEPDGSCSDVEDTAGNAYLNWRLQLREYATKATQALTPEHP